MAHVLVTLRIMPTSPDTDLSAIDTKAQKLIAAFTGKSAAIKAERKPVAFGLNALEIVFVMDESKGGTETLEKEIVAVEGVNSAEVIDVRRTIG
jgi:elongation factor 1-beta